MKGCGMRLAYVGTALLGALATLAASAGVGTIGLGWTQKAKMCTAPPASLGRGCDVATDCGTGGVCASSICTAGSSNLSGACASAGDCGTAGTCTPITPAAGWRAFYGTASNTYTQQVDFTTNPATLTGLDDCKEYFVALKAVNAAGTSRNFSNELGNAWARLRVDSIGAVTWITGQSQTLTLTGANFRVPPGGTLRATLLPPISGPPSITGAVSVGDCTHATVTFVIPPDAPPGPRVLQLSGESYVEASGLALAPFVVLVPDPIGLRRPDKL